MEKGNQKTKNGKVWRNIENSASASTVRQVPMRDFIKR
jgi:hypothetical protein